MSKEKTEGSKVLEEALQKSCESYCERYPRYEGEIDLGKDYADYERQLLNHSKAHPRKYSNAVAKRSSVLAASLILFFACSMAILWTCIIFYGTPSDQTEPPDFWTTETGSTEDTNGMLGSAHDTTCDTTCETIETSGIYGTPGTTPGTTDTRPTQSATDTSASDKPLVEVPDETSAAHIFLETNGDGLQIKVTVYGYQRKNTKRLFYVKNNEYIIVDVELTNFSAVPVYQRKVSYNYGIAVDLVYGGYRLNVSPFDTFSSGTKGEWTVEPGETYKWRLKLVAGDLPDAEQNDLSGIRLYGEEIYDNGICTFSGKISFSYAKSEEQHANNLRLSIPISFNVLYVSSDPNP
jgi:hypothetical protein